MVLPSRLGCPLSLKTPNMGNTGLIAFGPAPRHGLLDFVRIQRELEEVFGRQVDLISRRAVEQSRNPFRRKAILESARVVYERV